ncbi:hypothetical protein SB775_32945, partial [Peribacillus sp. SIMBA_075]|uniref:hypothetical protein n=1 Tax=Peribacillus sp. SIMBA_075 TaxID=3085813 RepID=UPI00397E4F92
IEHRHEEVLVRQHLVPGRVHRVPVSHLRRVHLVLAVPGRDAESATPSRGVCAGDDRDGVSAKQTSGAEELVALAVQSHLET